MWLGGPQSGSVFKQPVRVLEVDTGKTDAQGRAEILLLATSRLDLAAELVALGYRFRWTVEEVCASEMTMVGIRPRDGAQNPLGF